MLRSAPDEGRAREASQCGSRHGPVTGLANLSTGGPGCAPLTRDWVEAAADLAVTASGSRRTGTACPPKKAVREAASRLFHHSHASSSRAADRATLDCLKLRAEASPEPTGAGSSTSLFDTSRSTPLDVMAGLGPATHVLRPVALPRRGSPAKAGDSVERAMGRRVVCPLQTPDTTTSHTRLT